MEIPEILRLVLLVAHLVGLSVLLGAVVLQLRTTEGFLVRPMLVGAIVQIVTGAGLIAARRYQDLPVIEAKMAVKLAIALLTLAVVIMATVVQRRAMRAWQPDRAVRPFVLAAGLGALADAAVAVTWT